MGAKTHSKLPHYLPLEQQAPIPLNAARPVMVVQVAYRWCSALLFILKAYPRDTSFFTDRGLFALDGNGVDLHL